MCRARHDLSGHPEKEGNDRHNDPCSSKTLKNCTLPEHLVDLPRIERAPSERHWTLRDDPEF